MKALIALGVLALVIVGFIFFRLPQPIIELRPEAIFSIGGFAVTNTILTSWILVALICLGTFLGTRKLTLVPRGFQNVFEAVIEGFGNLVNSVAGEKNGRRFFPLVFVFLFYIVLANWSALLPIFNHIGKTEDLYHELSLEAENPATADHIFPRREVSGWVMTKGGVTMVPLFKKVDFIKVEIPENSTYRQAFEIVDEELTTKLGREEYKAATGHPLKDNEMYGFIAPFLRGVNTDINAPLSYALWSAIFVEFWGVATLGLFGYGSKFFNVKKLLKGDILNGVIDLFVGILELVSELSRFISFTFRLFGNIFAGEVLLFMMSFLVPFVLINVFYGLELFVGLIQGFVFAMLTLVFAVIAVTGHGDHEEHGDAQHGEGADEHRSVHA